MDAFETMIDGLLHDGFGTADGFISQDLMDRLRQRLLQLHADGEMFEAGVGKKFDFQKNAAVRGDVIYWLDPKNGDLAELEFLDHLQAFVDYLNRTCYTGINAFECHFAYYDTGSFYRRHIDQFRSDRGRQFSLVTYLNEGWADSDGGALGIYTGENDAEIFPLGGRAVFFRSAEVEHEVKEAVRPRLSIAGWLKRV